MSFGVFHRFLSLICLSSFRPQDFSPATVLKQKYILLWHVLYDSIQYIQPIPSFENNAIMAQTVTVCEYILCRSTFSYIQLNKVCVQLYTVYILSTYLKVQLLPALQSEVFSATEPAIKISGITFRNLKQRQEYIPVDSTRALPVSYTIRHGVYYSDLSGGKLPLQSARIIARACIKAGACSMDGA